jgi:hypothetical protein
MAKLRVMISPAGISRCRVSYLDHEGTDHAVEVEAESLYEAVAMAVAVFRQGEIITETLGPMTEFCVTVIRKPIEHRIRLAQVTKWAEPNTREGPAGITKRQKVRGLLGEK